MPLYTLRNILLLVEIGIDPSTLIFCLLVWKFSRLPICLASTQFYTSLLGSHHMHSFPNMGFCSRTWYSPDLYILCLLSKQSGILKFNSTSTIIITLNDLLLVTVGSNFNGPDRLLIRLSFIGSDSFVHNNKITCYLILKEYN